MGLAFGEQVSVKHTIFQDRQNMLCVLGFHSLLQNIQEIKQAFDVKILSPFFMSLLAFTKLCHFLGEKKHFPSKIRAFISSRFYVYEMQPTMNVQYVSQSSDICTEHLLFFSLFLKEYRITILGHISK